MKKEKYYYYNKKTEQWITEEEYEQELKKELKARTQKRYYESCIIVYKEDNPYIQFFKKEIDEILERKNYKQLKMEI